jgi:hypothetical protein
LLLAGSKPLVQLPKRVCVIPLANTSAVADAFLLLSATTTLCHTIPAAASACPTHNTPQLLLPRFNCCPAHCHTRKHLLRLTQQLQPVLLPAARVLHMHLLPIMSACCARLVFLLLLLLTAVHCALRLWRLLNPSCCCRPGGCSSCCSILCGCSCKLGWSSCCMLAAWGADLHPAELPADLPAPTHHQLQDPPPTPLPPPNTTRMPQQTVPVVST